MSDESRDKMRVVQRWDVEFFVQRRRGEPELKKEPRQRVVFNGSSKAFEIWKMGHQIPEGAEVVHSRSE